MTPEPKGESKTVKLVCLDCGKETMVEGNRLDYWPPPMIDRLVAVYSRCPACELKFIGWAAMANKQ